MAGLPPGEGTVVVAAHGITANAMSWARIALELEHDTTFVALDHRGRGESCLHPGPYGLAAHGRDCIRILDELSAARGVLVGHSMGAYVAARAAADFPDRVAAIVLVDGGLPLPLPADVDPADAVESVVGLAVARLGLTWPDLAAVHEMWRAHPAFHSWGPWPELYVGHDVGPGADGTLGCRVSEAAVRADGADVIVDPTASEKILECSAPTWLLRAPRGVLDDPDEPLLTDDVVRALHRARPDVDIIALADSVNHYSVMWSDPGAFAVAAAIRDALAVR